MLDTNVFDRVVKSSVPIELFLGKSLVVTHVQHDELSATPNLEIRQNLLSCISSVSPKKIPTESLVWNVSKWDEGKWGGEDGLFEKLKYRLIADDAKSKKKRGNQEQDCLIAETAIKNSLILVTDDTNLRIVTIENGGTAISLPDFMNLSENN